MRRLKSETTLVIDERDRQALKKLAEMARIRMDETKQIISAELTVQREKFGNVFAEPESENAYGILAARLELSVDELAEVQRVMQGVFDL